MYELLLKCGAKIRFLFDIKAAEGVFYALFSFQMTEKCLSAFHIPSSSVGVVT